MFKILAFGLILLLAFSAPLHADDFSRFKTTTQLYIEASNFYWDEHMDGSKLLDETGWIYGLGLTVKDICRESLSFKPDLYRVTFGGNVKYQFGEVDYDGQTQNGTPARTKVDYSGFTFEANVGGLFKTNASWWFVEPRLSLGYSTWTRDLKSNGYAIGYKEYWQNFYSRFGAQFTFLFKSDYRLGLFAGISLPLWVANDADLGGGASIGLLPEPYHPTPYIDLAFEYKRFGVGIYYEAFRFGESDLVRVGDGYVLQPESYTSKVGLRLMCAFY